MEFLSTLNAQQRQAVEAGDGPVLIIAGPGTGKTKTLTARIAYLLASGQASPKEILALTFTAKAAREMSQRVAGLIGDKPLPAIATFHALGYELLSARASEKLAFIDEPQRLALIRALPKPAALKGLTARELALRVSKHKGSQVPSDDTPIATLLAAYNQALHDQQLLDFDDLLAQTFSLLGQNPGLRAQLQARYRYILVDEFQDTSQLQWALVQQLRGNDNIFVIGDPLQSIYGFRGAGAEMFGQFQADFPKHRLVTLGINYRSARAIVELAKAVFPGQVTLQPASLVPGQVQAIETLHEYSEAALAVQLTQQAIGGSDMLSATVDGRNRHFKDFSIIYRTHQAAKAVQRQLQESGLPFQVVGEGSPYEQPDLQAVVGALRWLYNRAQPPSIKGFSEAQVVALLKGIVANLSVSQLAQSIIQTFALGGDDATAQRRLHQFVSTVVRFDGRRNGLGDCVAHLDRLAENEFYDPKADAITLTTIHAAKGLEFTHVILLACEDGILPHIRKQSLSDFAEERRLFYVAITRAKEQCDILYTRTRGKQPAKVSRFVAEISEAILPRIPDPNLAALTKRRQKRRLKNRQTTLF